MDRRTLAMICAVLSLCLLLTLVAGFWVTGNADCFGPGPAYSQPSPAPNEDPGLVYLASGMAAHEVFLGRCNPAKIELAIEIGATILVAFTIGLSIPKKSNVPH